MKASFPVFSAVEAFWWAAESRSGFTNFFFTCFYPILSNGLGFFGLYEPCFSILHSRSWSSYSRISRQFPWEGGAPLSGWFQDEVCPLEHVLDPWWKHRNFPCQAWVTLPVSVQTHCVMLAGFAESGFFPKMNARHCGCCCMLEWPQSPPLLLGDKTQQTYSKVGFPRLWLYFITELKAGWGWKRPLHVIWSSPMTQAGLSRASCPGSSPGSF